MNHLRSVYKVSFVMALTVPFVWWTHKLPMFVNNGALVFENPRRADTVEASRGLFNDLFELFHTMNTTANWTDPDLGHRMIPNFVPRQISTSAEDIVLATHSDVSKVKLGNLMEQVSRWGGAVSVALYIKDETGISALQEVLSNNTLLPNMGIHLMLDLPNDLGYPHNILRNLAMDNLGSDFFLALDVDFMPQRNSHKMLMTLMGNNSEDSGIRQEMMQKRLFVLPAFQIYSKENETIATVDLIPESKAEVLDMVLDGKATGFAMHTFPCGHRPTNFVKWFETTGGQNRKGFYDIGYKTNFEPYVVGYRPGIPRYWTSVRGFGYDKVGFFYEVHRAGYSFAVLRDQYLVHMQHPTYFKDYEHERNKRKMVTFWAYLDATYNQSNIPPKYKCFKPGWGAAMRDIRARYRHSRTTILEAAHDSPRKMNMTSASAAFK